MDKFKMKIIAVFSALCIFICFFILKDMNSNGSTNQGNNVSEETSVLEDETKSETNAEENSSKTSQYEEINAAADEYIQRVEEKNEANKKRANYNDCMVLIGMLQSDQTGVETVDDKVFLYSDYENGEQDAIIEAFDYARSGKDNYYITYYLDDTSNIVGVQYQKETEELDQVYAGNSMTGD